MTRKPIEVIFDASREIYNSRRIFVLTGAGVSAESGVPTFRGGGGAPVWRGMPFDQLSSARMVRDNLPLVWEWFNYRRELLQACRPNPGHIALSELERKVLFEQFTIATQNIDGLHESAGSSCVLELHGNIWRARCTRCGSRCDNREANSEGQRPDCSECRAPMRPDVVLFGEQMPAGVMEQAQSAAVSSDLCLIVGTSALVYPAAMLPELAAEAGARLIEINPETTAISHICHISIRGEAGTVLPALASSLLST